MREIKFRAWNIKTKQMIYNEVLVGNNLIQIPIDEVMCGTYNFEEIIPMQYTGLKDKNNKEIYEGDIIETSYNNKLYVVYMGDCIQSINYDEYTTNYHGVGFKEIKHYVSNKDYNQPDEYFFYESEIKIVGNIYENPELLEQK